MAPRSGVVLSRIVSTSPSNSRLVHLEAPLGSYQYRFNQLEADDLPINPISYHPPADGTTLRAASVLTFGDTDNFVQLLKALSGRVAREWGGWEPGDASEGCV